MGNKQGELECLAQSQGCDIIDFSEAWRDGSHNWSTEMNSFRLYRRDRPERRGGGVALYIKEGLHCMELSYGDEKAECLWVRVRGKANMEDTVVGVYYRPGGRSIRNIL